MSNPGYCTKLKSWSNCTDVQRENAVWTERRQTKTLQCIHYPEVGSYNSPTELSGSALQPNARRKIHITHYPGLPTSGPYGTITIKLPVKRTIAARREREYQPLLTEKAWIPRCRHNQSGPLSLQWYHSLNTVWKHDR